MPERVLIAAELRQLVGDDPVPGYVVEWIAADAPTPRDEHVAIVPLLSRWLGGEQLKGLPNLRIVANCAVGVDNVDLVAAEFRHIVVTNTPDVLTPATADLTWALILACTRRIKEGMDAVAHGHWSGWHPTELLGLQLDQATLGIVGAGRIGQAVGERAAGFGTRVLYASRSAKPDFATRTGAERRDLRALLQESDVVSVHVPATHDTKAMFDRERFAQFRSGAYFINTSRGDVVREPALIEALDDGPLAGAGLDVYADEPNVPEALQQHPRVVTLPHIGSATETTRKAMAELAVHNVRSVLAGEPPLTPAYR